MGFNMAEKYFMVFRQCRFHKLTSLFAFGIRTFLSQFPGQGLHGVDMIAARTAPGNIVQQVQNLFGNASRPGVFEPAGGDKGIQGYDSVIDRTG
jgi:hypothetical protein